MTEHVEPYRDESFRAFSAIFLLVLSELLALLFALAQRAANGTKAATEYWYYPGIYAMVVALSLSIVLKPKLLFLSNWRPKPKHFLLAALPPLLIQSVPMFFVSDPNEYFVAPTLSHVIFIAILGPTLEEIFCRGVILRSLTMRMSRFAAVAVVSVLVSLGHASFWDALPRQIIICLVYLATDDSLAASIFCHMVLNSFVLLPIAAFFQRWHV
jgi:membrane protease YdiL (CAAX protease family)